jgi:hypothetical protein
MKRLNTLNPPKACPSDPASLAEAYLLNRLPPAEVEAFENHYIICPPCAGMLKREQELLDQIQAALRIR